MEYLNLYLTKDLKTDFEKRSKALSREASATGEIQLSEFLYAVTC
jgi:hypothetical protein